MSVLGYTAVIILVLAAAMALTRLDVDTSDSRKCCPCEG